MENIKDRIRIALTFSPFVLCVDKGHGTVSQEEVRGLIDLLQDKVALDLLLKEIAPD
jgi:hypothetical protein